MIVYSLDKRSHPTNLFFSATPTANPTTASGVKGSSRLKQLSTFNKDFLKYIGCTLVE